MNKINLDVIFVTYNSQKWIKSLLESIHNSDISKFNLKLIFVDNNSKDNTIDEINKYGNDYSLDYEIIMNENNLGFGHGCNIGAKNSVADYLFFLNIDTEVNKETFNKIYKNLINQENNVGAFELKQTPYEHPKYYDPITFETSWFSGACVIIPRHIFAKVNGFDELIFMYAEDVDLSWRIRNLGYKIKYLQDTEIIHYSYNDVNEVKRSQFFNSSFNNILLRYRYGSIITVLIGYLLLLKIYFNESIFDDHKHQILQFFKKSLKLGMNFRGSIFRKYKNIKPKFYGFDYERNKAGEFHNFNDLNIQDGPLVSIVVRTHKRKEVLREALISLKNQRYNNFEVIIAEDGEPTAKNMIEKEFSDLNYVYFATEKSVGRSIAGNMALKLCKGEYINFLDDDDLFYPDHLEILVNEIVKDKSLEAVYSTAFQTPIKINSKVPYIYNILDKNVLIKHSFSRDLLCRINIFPIQTVLFSKEFFNKNGGFNPDLDYLEDWDLWLRYFENPNIKFVERTTSVYRVPGSKRINKQRQELLNINYKEIKSKYYKPYEELGEMPKIENSQSIKHYIDNIVINGNKLHISGWAYSNSYDSIHTQVKGFLEIDNDIKLFKSKKMIREDVSNHFNNKYGKHSGFHIEIDISKKMLLKKSSIKLCLERDNCFYELGNISLRDLPSINKTIIINNIKITINKVKQKLLQNLYQN